MSDNMPSSGAVSFRWPIRVYYEDTDAGGVVYHAGYLRFFERARTERLRAMGYEQDQLRDRDGILFAVRAMHIDFLKPARFNDACWATADFGEVKRASLAFRQALVRSDGELLCRAEVKVVCISAAAFRPTPIPDFLLREFAAGASILA